MDAHRQRNRDPQLHRVGRSRARRRRAAADGRGRRARGDRAALRGVLPVRERERDVSLRRVHDGVLSPGRIAVAVAATMDVHADERCRLDLFDCDNSVNGRWGAYGPVYVSCVPARGALMPYCTRNRGHEMDGASQVQVGSFSSMVMQCLRWGLSATGLREGMLALYKAKGERGYWVPLLPTAFALREVLDTGKQNDWVSLRVCFCDSADDHPCSRVGQWGRTPTGYVVVLYEFHRG